MKISWITTSSPIFRGRTWPTKLSCSEHTSTRMALPPVPKTMRPVPHRSWKRLEQFEAVGLPVFPFLQDPVENDSRSFHSNMDVYDRIVPEYLIQGAVVAASLAYHAAMRDEKMPRVQKH